MSTNEHLPRGRASLEVLRAEAADELDTIVHERLLAGEDPWDFMEELPTVDELVVYLLRADNINENGGQRPGSSRNYRVLRQIALDHPGLTRAVWRLIGDQGAFPEGTTPANLGRTSG
ncbi:tryptophan synthase subunit alpha [Herbiconiux sp. CPCC 205763]|uniref:Tryptophan synthase subunit alpha n=1 Tax=Herbiconiux aconitum TaxID=2970913 RepID=A0ABT2GSM3_9MICO|nr:tryptophan synthase subunit alpha [Herbiconiux aconitum]MCS5717826.1 tryptophan synthase subunit alpha [Herbiconiux aconitum]